tara:strand:- start:209 stop:1081 length:873 start_codon:yes stop_codon:yes gene_type:complete
MKKILCVVDSYSWALYNRAVALEKAYPMHKFDIIHFNDLRKRKLKTLKIYDIVYVLNWPIAGLLFDLKRTRPKDRFVVGASSHIRYPAKSVLTPFDAVGVSNKMLYLEYKNRYPKSKIIYTPFGVDCNVFYPQTDPADFHNVFGFVGTSRRAVKRFSEIKKAIESFGSKVEFITATNRAGYSREQMAEFYNRIGTLICFSESEGTPNPVLEAAACGRSVISTPVGNVPELFRAVPEAHVVTSFFELRRAISRSIKSPNKIKRIGEKLAIEAAKNWSWEKQAKAFGPFLGI